MRLLLVQVEYPLVAPIMVVYTEVVLAAMGETHQHLDILQLEEEEEPLVVMAMQDTMEVLVEEAVE
jgi:hypothetical protein